MRSLKSKWNERYANSTQSFLYMFTFAVIGITAGDAGKNVPYKIELTHRIRNKIKGTQKGNANQRLLHTI